MANWDAQWTRPSRPSARPGRRPLHVTLPRSLSKSSPRLRPRRGDRRVSDGTEGAGRGKLLSRLRRTLPQRGEHLGTTPQLDGLDEGHALNTRGAGRRVGAAAWTLTKRPCRWQAADQAAEGLGDAGPGDAVVVAPAAEAHPAGLVQDVRAGPRTRSKTSRRRLRPGTSMPSAPRVGRPASCSAPEVRARAPTFQRIDVLGVKGGSPLSASGAAMRSCTARRCRRMAANRPTPPPPAARSGSRRRPAWRASSLLTSVTTMARAWRRSRRARRAALSSAYPAARRRSASSARARGPPASGRPGWRWSPAPHAPA